MVILSLRDLSVRKKLEAEREEMQRQLYQSSKLASVGELSAGVAHEINNPLNGIINFAQLLKDEERPRSTFEQQMIDGIIDEGERIAKIVRGLLTFASGNTHELRRSPSPTRSKPPSRFSDASLKKTALRSRLIWSRTFRSCAPTAHASGRSS